MLAINSSALHLHTQPQTIIRSIQAGQQASGKPPFDR